MKKHLAFIFTRMLCVALLLLTRHAGAQDTITGPWLWMIAPTAPGQGGAASTDVDSLKAASQGAVTETWIAKNDFAVTS